MLTNLLGIFVGVEKHIEDQAADLEVVDHLDERVESCVVHQVLKFYSEQILQADTNIFAMMIDLLEKDVLFQWGFTVQHIQYHSLCKNALPVLSLFEVLFWILEPDGTSSLIYCLRQTVVTEAIIILSFFERLITEDVVIVVLNPTLFEIVIEGD
jgi:hypothetical protein